MQIALIGGSGFVGSRLLENEMAKYQVKNFDKQNSKLFPEITTIVDVRDLDGLKESLKSVDLVILLAAEHRDDVSPKSLYYDINVGGTENVLKAMSENNINEIIFTSSVAVYGLNKINPNEQHPEDPFNHYGKSKLEAERVLKKWYDESSIVRKVTIIRPTVIFGERNRGNVYNLLKQIASEKFLMIGNGNNKKSMAYVGNIVAFIKYNIEEMKGFKTYIYTDGPDLTMNELVLLIEKVLGKKLPAIKLPYFIGLIAGYAFDIIAKLWGTKLPVSSVRVRKFCATTQFNSENAHKSGFNAPFTLNEGISKTLQYEFNSQPKDDVIFITE